MAAADDYSALLKDEAQSERDLELKSGETSKNVRKDTLATADGLVNGDRNRDYGDPTGDFDRTARYWNTHLTGVIERKLGGHEIEDVQVRWVLNEILDSWDVAIMMNLLKQSRLAWAPQKHDNWVDTAGYAACGAECVDVRMNGGLA